MVISLRKKEVELLKVFFSGYDSGLEDEEWTKVCNSFYKKLCK